MPRNNLYRTDYHSSDPVTDRSIQHLYELLEAMRQRTEAELNEINFVLSHLENAVESLSHKLAS